MASKKSERSDMVAKDGALTAVGPRFSDLVEIAERLQKSAKEARQRVGQVDSVLYGRAEPKDMEINPRPSGGFFNDHGSVLQDTQDNLDRVNETLVRIIAEFGAMIPPTATFTSAGTLTVAQNRQVDRR